MADNQLSYGACFTGLTALTQLNLGANLLPGLPASLGCLTALQALLVSGNQLALLPASLGQLTALTRLDVSMCRCVIGLCACLVVIIVCSCLCAVWNILFGDRIVRCSCPTQQAAPIPSSVRCRGHHACDDAEHRLLRTSLALCRLAALPDSTSCLTALRTLQLHGNQLRLLPPGLHSLDALSCFTLHSNQLAALPPNVGAMRRISSLDLSGNSLAVLPESFGTLTGLTALQLAGNQLDALPPALPALQHLCISRNNVHQLPDWLAVRAGIPRLVYVSLQKHMYLL